jgi:hypothetical protein
MEAKFADALERLFPTPDGNWGNDDKTYTYGAQLPDGRALKFAMVKSIENYHIAITCSRPDRKVSARHRIVFNLKNGIDNSDSITERIKNIIDLELGQDFLRISRYDSRL